MISVGKMPNAKKKVSALNHELFVEGKEIFNDPKNMGQYHMGWIGLGAFVDWLEENYDIKKKG